MNKDKSESARAIKKAFSSIMVAGERYHLDSLISQVHTITGETREDIYAWAIKETKKGIIVFRMDKYGGTSLRDDSIMPYECEKFIDKYFDDMPLWSMVTQGDLEEHCQYCFQTMKPSQVHKLVEKVAAKRKDLVVSMKTYKKNKVE